MEALRALIPAHDFAWLADQVAATRRDAIVAGWIAGRYVVVVLKIDGAVVGWLLAPAESAAEARTMAGSLGGQLEATYPALRAARAEATAAILRSARAG